MHLVPILKYQTAWPFLLSRCQLIPMNSHHQSLERVVETGTNALFQGFFTTPIHWRASVPLIRRACWRWKQRRFSLSQHTTSNVHLYSSRCDLDNDQCKVCTLKLTCNSMLLGLDFGRHYLWKGGGGWCSTIKVSSHLFCWSKKVELPLLVCISCFSSWSSGYHTQSTTSIKDTDCRRGIYNKIVVSFSVHFQKHTFLASFWRKSGVNVV